jgi:hypothetical protein
MTPLEEQDLWAFAGYLAQHPGMPPLYRWVPPLPRRFHWRILRAILVSRWDMIQEHSDPYYWASEFIKAGGLKRVNCTVTFYQLLFLTGIGAELLSWQAWNMGIAELMAWAALDPRNWFCLVVPVVIPAACALHLRKDWPAPPERSAHVKSTLPG